MPVHQFFDELDALELEDLNILVLPPVERHSNRPRASEDFRVLDGGPIVDTIGANECESLHDVERLAVEIAGAIKPRLTVEARHVDDEGVTLPAPYRLPHPGVHRRRLRLPHL